MSYPQLLSSAPEIIGAALTLFGGAGIVYAYFGYPFILWLLSRFRRPFRADLTYQPGITIIIAAHNEERSIGAKLEETLELEYPASKLQIIVASDGSTDGTNGIVAEYADRGVELIVIEDRIGKTNAQNLAVQSARNPILVFSDATTRYHRQSLFQLAGCYADPKVGAASGRYDYVAISGNSPSAAGSHSMWNLENLIKRMQSRLGTLTGCSGCIYSVRRELYTVLSPEVISDLVQPLQVVLQGYRVVFQEAAQAWEEPTQTAGDEFRMRVRVAARGMKGLYSVRALLSPWKHPVIAFQLWSHKVLRWCVPDFLIALLAGSLFLASHPFFLFLLILQLFFYGAAVAALVIPPLRGSRLASLPLYFCTLNTAFLFGMIYAVRGRTFTTWKPIRG